MDEFYKERVNYSSIALKNIGNMGNYIRAIPKIQQYRSCSQLLKDYLFNKLLL